MTPGDRSPVPPAGEQAGAPGDFNLRHAGCLPEPPEELINRLAVERTADETEWREAYAQRRALYAQRSGPEQPKPVRLKNLALLKQLEALQPALEAHLQAYHIWRLLGEACDYLQARQIGRCRNRLKEAAGLLEKQPHDALRQWYNDIEADIADKEAGAAAQPKPENPAGTPPRPPPMVVAPAEATAIEGGAVACAVAVWPKEAVVEVSGLPAGLKFDAARGQIAGIPTAPGESTIVITASDSSGQSSARILLRVAARAHQPELRPPRLVHPAAIPAGVGIAFDWAPVVENGPATISFEELPPGLKGDPASGRIHGVPERPGSVPVTLVATNRDGATRSRLLLDIAPATPTAPPPVPTPPVVEPPGKAAIVAAAAPVAPPPVEVAKAPPPFVPPKPAETPVPTAPAPNRTTPVAPKSSNTPFPTVSKTGTRSSAAFRPVPGTFLQLLPRPAEGGGPPPGPPIHFVARPRFILGRRLASVDFVAVFFPENPENRQKTEMISRVNTTLFLKGNQILLQDGELVEEGKFKASTNGTILDGQTVTTPVPVSFTKERRIRLGQSGYELAVLQLPAVAPGGPLTPPTASLSTQPTLLLSQRPLGCLRFRPVSCREVRVAAIWVFSEAVVGSDAQSAVVLNAPGVPPIAARFHHWREGFWVEVPVEGKSVITLDGRQRAAGDVVPLQPLHQLRIGDLNYEMRVS
jgi:hypothetical protein